MEWAPHAIPQLSSNNSSHTDADVKDFPLPACPSEQTGILSVVCLGSLSPLPAHGAGAISCRTEAYRCCIKQVKRSKNQHHLGNQGDNLSVEGGKKK